MKRCRSIPVDSCSYDKNRDKDFVRSGLAMDIQTAIDTQTVVSTGIDVEYQGGPDMSVESVGNRVVDAFEAMDYQRKLFKKSGKSQASVKPDSGKSE